MPEEPARLADLARRARPVNHLASPAEAATRIHGATIVQCQNPWTHRRLPSRPSDWTPRTLTPSWSRTRPRSSPPASRTMPKTMSSPRSRCRRPRLRRMSTPPLCVKFDGFCVIYLLGVFAIGSSSSIGFFRSIPPVNYVALVCNYL